MNINVDVTILLNELMNINDNVTILLNELMNENGQGTRCYGI